MIHFRLFFALLLFSSCASVPEKKIQLDHPELTEMVRIDQENRRNDANNLEETDKKHRARVMELLARGMVKTPRDKFNAALILQHTGLTYCEGELMSFSAENYLLAHELSRSAWEDGLADAAYFTAVTFDRYVLYTTGRQKFGTQKIYDEPSDSFLWAPIDSATTDEERARYNVPKLVDLLKEVKVKTENGVARPSNAPSF